MRGLILTFALLPLPALAAEPYCQVEETCTVTSDNCQPAEGRIMLHLHAAENVTKATILLDGERMGTGSVLGLHNVTAIMFTTEDGIENQMRIQENGRFNYLVSRPDAQAHKGKDQMLYRGQCVEGTE
ncbi:hypothetical protein RXV86_05890 [Alisedimentitalea sp. MJ-SS2]|uniref:hypothetical protein n=1 Tax=Aliisedimentitalea sp. MJ-SS2 TaxID=3049795 RepID=UPI002914061C|nr:hypothetical protein [Alisedimentitalea sp. MJ-SS2]MDU8926908.1 hypothetical protein [Alisedimentitalea sp. MJ-SS2]